MPIAGMTDDTIRGVDISSYLALKNAGVKYRDFNGNEASLVKVLADAGVNYVRLRIWNDPYDVNNGTYGGGICDEATELAIAREASHYGMKVLIDLHYSDFWADPATQPLPKAWKNLSENDLTDEIYLWTKSLMTHFQAAGVNIGMVQLGNEITHGVFGIITPGSSDVYKDQASVAKIAKYINAGSRAVREVAPSTQVAVQLETPSLSNYQMILDGFAQNNVDYDVLGTSYYPFWGWGGNNPTNLAAVERMIGQRYGKKVVVMETAWPMTQENADGTPNNVDWDPGYYPVSPQGQVDESSAMYKAILSHANGLGAFYWEPAWVPTRAGWDNWQYNKNIAQQYGTGWANENSLGYYPDSKMFWQGNPAWGADSWDNMTLFDDNGFPLQSLKMYGQF